MKKNILAILLSLSLILFFTSVTYSYTPGSVEVTVKDFYSGSLLEGAEVKMEPGGHSGTTGTGGTVTLTGIIPYRNYAVTVSLEGYIEGLYGEGKTGLISVQTGQTTPVTVPVKKKASITGQVTSGGTPIAGAWVVLVHDPIMPSEGAYDLHVARTKTSTSGNYELSSVPSGDYSLVAVADSYYQVIDPVTIGADDVLTHDFSLTPGTSSLTYSISPTNYKYGQSSVLRAWDGGNLMPPDDITEKYIDVIDAPPGEDFQLGSDPYKFIPMGPGGYTVAMMVVDLNGVGIEESSVVTMVNSAPESYPSIIPGPSELPQLYNSTVNAVTAGSSNVNPGTDVYLRGWGRDFNLGSTEEFNPGAPMFDIYGNKNGDWSQSAFSFEWSLRDGAGTDQTSLLNTTTSENVHFTVPAGAQSGDEYIATLTVTDDRSLAGTPAEVSVVVAYDTGWCTSCHADVVATYVGTTHSSVAPDPVGCVDCHGPDSVHVFASSEDKVSTSSKTHWPGNCGQCHEQFAQWQKSRHSDPLAFGHAEISGALLSVCYKCHYTEGFIGAVESVEDFKDFAYPMFYPVPKDTPNISCDVCHDPHVQSVSNPTGIRTGSEASLCVTCHNEKWQNATYSATGGEIGNAYHWPETDYTQYEGAGNPHQMPKACVTCHMAKDITDVDSNGVRKIGAHSLRMRDVGADGDPGTADDLLNIAVCQTCHGGLTTFDRNATMTIIKNKLDTLGDLLKVNNHEYLPPFQPGKCATCHRGGTLPFISDTETKTLENAYLNYKLILHDRSFGIHNPGYIERLLDDSIAAIVAITVMSDSDFDGIDDLEDNCPNNCNVEQKDADGDGIGDVCDPDDGCFSCGNGPICEIECIVDTPAPPVNQTIALPDTVLNDLVEAECRACHDDPEFGGPSNPDRHHLLYGTPIIKGKCQNSGIECLTDADCAPAEVCTGETAASNPLENEDVYACLSCHDEDTNSGTTNFLVERDCLVCHAQVPGEASVHHLTGTAQGTDSPLGDPLIGDCTPCHGTFVDDFGDNANIPTYAPSLVTPSVREGTADEINIEGNRAGSCVYCHSTGTGSSIPGIDTESGVNVYRNGTLHHTAGVDKNRYRDPVNGGCELCHGNPIDFGGDALALRNCEQCHGFESLHNIQADSPNAENIGTIVIGGEDYGYGHVGIDDPSGESDCWGCHGFGFASTSAPAAGPVTPYLSDSDEQVIITGTDTELTLSGSSLTNTFGTTEFVSTFILTSKDGEVFELLPEQINASSSTITIPSTTAPGNYLLTAEKDNGAARSNPLPISIKPLTSIEEISGDCADELTISGTGFGAEPPASAEEYINVMQKNLSLNIVHWTDSSIIVTGADCDGSPITVNALMGSATK